MDDSIGQVCHVDEESEVDAAFLLGGKLKIEKCGFFFNCTKTLKLTDTSGEPIVSADLMLCEPNMLYIGVTVVCLLLVVVAALRFMKRKRKE